MPGAAKPRDLRLHYGWQFREVYRSGKSIHGNLMTLVTMARPGDVGRIAFVAGRKVGPAVRRNRAKRLLREAFRALPHEIRGRTFWRVWIARTPCATATLGAVSSQMNHLLNQESA